MHPPKFRSFHHRIICRDVKHLAQMQQGDFLVLPKTSFLDPFSEGNMHVIPFPGRQPAAKIRHQDAQESSTLLFVQFLFNGRKPLK